MGEINQRLKRFFLAKELDQIEVAKMLNVSKQRVNNWLTDTSIPMYVFKDILTVWPELNLSWLFTGSGNMQGEQNPNTTSTQEPIPPYGECTNPRCTEKIAYLTERVEELRKDKEFLRDMLQRKEVPPENKSEGGVDQAKKAS